MAKQEVVGCEMEAPKADEVFYHGQDHGAVLPYRRLLPAILAAARTGGPGQWRGVGRWGMRRKTWTGLRRKSEALPVLDGVNSGWNSTG